MWRSLHTALAWCKPPLYGVVVKCFDSGQFGPGVIPGQCKSWSRRLQSSKVVCSLQQSSPPHSLKHLAQSTFTHLCSATSMLGGALLRSLHTVSHHYGVVVKWFAYGQCGLVSIPGRCRSWSRRLQSSKKVDLSKLIKWIRFNCFCEGYRTGDMFAIICVLETNSLKVSASRNFDSPITVLHLGVHQFATHTVL